MHTCTRYATIPRSANPPDYAAARDASLPEHASHRLTNPTAWQPFPSKNVVYLNPWLAKQAQPPSQGARTASNP